MSDDHSHSLPVISSESGNEGESADEAADLERLLGSSEASGSAVSSPEEGGDAWAASLLLYGGWAAVLGAALLLPRWTPSFLYALLALVALARPTYTRDAACRPVPMPRREYAVYCMLCANLFFWSAVALQFVPPLRKLLCRDAIGLCHDLRLDDFLFPTFNPFKSLSLLLPDVVVMAAMAWMMRSARDTGALPMQQLVFQCRDPAVWFLLVLLSVLAVFGTGTALQGPLLGPPCAWTVLWATHNTRRSWTLPLARFGLLWSGGLLLMRRTAMMQTVRDIFPSGGPLWLGLRPPETFAARAAFLTVVGAYAMYCAASDRTVLGFAQSLRHRSGLAVQYVTATPFVQRHMLHLAIAFCAVASLFSVCAPNIVWLLVFALAWWSSPAGLLTSLPWLIGYAWLSILALFCSQLPLGDVAWLHALQRAMGQPQPWSASFNVDVLLLTAIALLLTLTRRLAVLHPPRPHWLAVPDVLDADAPWPQRLGGLAVTAMRAINPMLAVTFWVVTLHPAARLLEAGLLLFVVLLAASNERAARLGLACGAYSCGVALLKYTQGILAGPGGNPHYMWEVGRFMLLYAAFILQYRAWKLPRLVLGPIYSQLGHHCLLAASVLSAFSIAAFTAPSLLTLLALVCGALTAASPLANRQRGALRLSATVAGTSLLLQYGIEVPQLTPYVDGVNKALCIHPERRHLYPLCSSSVALCLLPWAGHLYLTLQALHQQPSAWDPEEPGLARLLNVLAVVGHWGAPKVLPLFILLVATQLHAPRASLVSAGYFALALGHLARPYAARRSAAVTAAVAAGNAVVWLALRCGDSAHWRGSEWAQYIGIDVVSDDTHRMHLLWPHLLVFLAAVLQLQCAGRGNTAAPPSQVCGPGDVPWLLGPICRWLLAALDRVVAGTLWRRHSARAVLLLFLLSLSYQSDTLWAYLACLVVLALLHYRAEPTLQGWRLELLHYALLAAAAVSYLLFLGLPPGSPAYVPLAPNIVCARRFWGKYFDYLGIVPSGRQLQQMVLQAWVVSLHRHSAPVAAEGRASVPRGYASQRAYAAGAAHLELSLADDLSESQQTEEPDAYPTPAAEGGDLYAAGLTWVLVSRARLIHKLQRRPQSIRDITTVLPAPAGREDYMQQPISSMRYVLTPQCWQWVRFKIVPWVLLVVILLQAASDPQHFTLFQAAVVVAALYGISKGVDLFWRGNVLWHRIVRTLWGIAVLEATFECPLMWPLLRFLTRLLLTEPPPDDEAVATGLSLICGSQCLSWSTVLLVFIVYLQLYSFDDPAFVFVLHAFHRDALEASNRAEHYLQRRAAVFAAWEEDMRACHEDRKARLRIIQDDRRARLGGATVKVRRALLSPRGTAPTRASFSVYAAPPPSPSLLPPAPFAAAAAAASAAPSRRPPRLEVGEPLTASSSAASSGSQTQSREGTPTPSPKASAVPRYTWRAGLTDWLQRQVWFTDEECPTRLNARGQVDVTWGTLASALVRFGSSHTKDVCFAAIFVNLLFSIHVADMVLPASVLGYGLLVDMPRHRYWVLCTRYLLLLVALRTFGYALHGTRLVDVLSAGFDIGLATHAQFQSSLRRNVGLVLCITLHRLAAHKEGQFWVAEALEREANAAYDRAKQQPAPPNAPPPPEPPAADPFPPPEGAPASATSASASTSSASEAAAADVPRQRALTTAPRAVDFLETVLADEMFSPMASPNQGPWAADEERQAEQPAGHAKSPSRPKPPQPSLPVVIVHAPRLGVSLSFPAFALGLLAFFVMLFSFSTILHNFSSDSDVLKGFRTNFIPGWLVVTELALFLMMAFDYAASILKDMRFKLLLHGLGTVALFSYMAVLYVLQQRPRGFSATLFLAVCLAWLVVSAKQVAWGYPRSFTPGALVERYSLRQHYLYILARSIPFAYEMAGAINWLFSSTGLSLWQWFKVEDMLDVLLAARHNQACQAGLPRDARGAVLVSSKMRSGCTLFAVLVLVLFFPLFTYSSFSPYLITNWVESAELQLRFSRPRTAALWRSETTRLQYDDDESVAQSDRMQNALGRFYPALRLNYVDRTIQVLTFEEASDSPWVVSVVKDQQIRDTLNRTESSVRLEMYAVLTAVRFPGGKGTLSPEYEVRVEMKAELAHVVVDGGRVTFPALYSPFVKNDANGIQFLDGAEDGAKNCTVTIAKDSSANGPNRWTIMSCQTLFDNGNDATNLSAREDACVSRCGRCPDYAGEAGRTIPGQSAPYLVVVSDKAPDSSGALGGFFSSVGISALYTTFVFALGKFFRSLFVGTTGRIPIEEMQNPQPLIDLVMDIKFARAEGFLDLERELYSEIVTIFRCGDLFQQWTAAPDPAGPPPPPPPAPTAAPPAAPPPPTTVLPATLLAGPAGPPSHVPPRRGSHTHTVDM